MTHPSLMPSFFAPSMPFHPEELYKHVRELERIYSTLPAADTNGRTALAKAIVAATASFVEGCLDSLSVQVLGELGVTSVLKPFLAKPRGYNEQVKRVRELAALRYGWNVNDATSRFVEDPPANNQPGLRRLRNLIDHGEVVATALLLLDDIGYFRRTARDYLEQVYASLGIPKPGWLAP